MAIKLSRCTPGSDGCPGRPGRADAGQVAEARGGGAQEYYTGGYARDHGECGA
ncbi:MAG: hypothetical protein ACLP5E_16115 [Streptosporangiaceae bacterium]